MTTQTGDLAQKKLSRCSRMCPIRSFLTSKTAYESRSCLCSTATDGIFYYFDSQTGVDQDDVSWEPTNIVTLPD